MVLISSHGLCLSSTPHPTPRPSRQSKDREVEEETETLERLQTELRLKIGEVEGEVGVVKTRMAAEFNTILKKREKEFTSKINELSTSRWDGCTRGGSGTREGQTRSTRIPSPLEVNRPHTAVCCYGRLQAKQYPWLVDIS